MLLFMPLLAWILFTYIYIYLYNYYVIFTATFHHHTKKEYLFYG